MRVRELVVFIKERESIRIKKEKGSPRPWTKDPILGKYRFCNVHREDDRVSRWLREHIYGLGWGADPGAWFMVVVCRLLNLPESIDAVKSSVLPFHPVKFAKTLHARKAAGLNNFNAAYIVSTNGVSMDKVDYLVQRVLTPLWAARKWMRPEDCSLAGYHERLMKFDGLGSFIAAQVVADLKYMEPLKHAPDWWTFAASGPGSRRGLNRVVGREVGAPWKEEFWHDHLMELWRRVQKFSIMFRGDHGLHAQDLQNCLCEFDKYERARLGEGTPKQIYKEK